MIKNDHTLKTSEVECEDDKIRKGCLCNMNIRIIKVDVEYIMYLSSMEMEVKVWFVNKQEFSFYHKITFIMELRIAIKIGQDIIYNFIWENL